ncbi:Gfo/Idh/MocA family protein [Enterovirga rhinocerotis]|uniref:Putative dehydrogenase n=1 Tax=Enterovirga rhinocerotis TaxID=1339210 RepID=A0A4R7C406_9HYPH|nr:Gfo/Idh/MocA family oxidoreductase [Enterovirga rhinocerotis]TDR93194.1 putative dehydrogenase [Enterovirga rhinocerotis]
MASTEFPKVAVVGVGIWGRNHARNHAEIGSLAAVVDKDAEAAARIAGQHGVPVRSFDEVLADPAIEGIVFALPPSQNLPLGRRAIEAGKHPFVEKPLAMNGRQGAELVALAEAADRRLMIGHILHYHPAFVALAGLVAEGRLGRILSCVSHRMDLGRIRREEDALWALGTHDVSMILRLMGADPLHVTATGGRHTHPTIADTTHVAMDFGAGAAAEIRVSWLHPFKEQRLVVIGEEAMAVFDDLQPWDTKLVLYRHRFGERDGRPFAEKADGEPVPVEPGEPLKRECLHFLASIRSGETPLTDGREGLRVLRVLERASASLADEARIKAYERIRGTPRS